METQIAIIVNGQVVEQVPSFKYLGSLIQDDTRCKDYVKTRLAMRMNIVIKLLKTTKHINWSGNSLSQE